jgi:hypothetical protein
MQQLRPLWTYDEVLDALDGPGAVGKLTGQSCSAVCNWKRLRGVFPSKYYFTIKSALADRGYYAPISLFGFHGAHKQPPRRRRSSTTKQHAA